MNVMATTHRDERDGDDVGAVRRARCSSGAVADGDVADRAQAAQRVRQLARPDAGRQGGRDLGAEAEGEGAAGAGGAGVGRAAQQLHLRLVLVCVWVVAVRAHACGADGGRQAAATGDRQREAGRRRVKRGTDQILSTGRSTAKHGPEQG